MNRELSTAASQNSCNLDGTTESKGTKELTIQDDEFPDSKPDSLANDFSDDANEGTMEKSDKKHREVPTAAPQKW